MAFFHEKSPSELDFEHHSDIALYYRYKLLLLKNVSPSCCSQLLSTGVIYSMANPDAMNAYLPPWEGAGAEVSPLACRALTTALSLTGSHWSIPEVSSTQPRTKPHCDLPDQGWDERGKWGKRRAQRSKRNCFHHSVTDFNEKYEKTALKLTFIRGFKSIWTSYASRDNCLLWEIKLKCLEMKFSSSSRQYVNTSQPYCSVFYG